MLGLLSRKISGITFSQLCRPAVTCEQSQRPADRKVSGFKGNMTEQRTVSCSEAKTFDFLLLELPFLAAAHRATSTSRGAKHLALKAQMDWHH